MLPRQIGALALVQTFALGSAILFSGVAVRFTQQDILGGRPLPALLNFAPYFRDYGIFSLALIVAWTALAAASTKSRSSLFPAATILSGLALVASFLLLAFAFFIISLTPIL